MSEKAISRIVNWVIAFILGAASFLIYMLATSNWTLLGLCNGFSVAAVVVILGFLLYIVTRLGTFDIFVYGFKDVFYHMNPDKNKVKVYADYPDYVEKKKLERNKVPVCFLPYLIIGLALLITALILRLVIYINIGF